MNEISNISKKDFLKNPDLKKNPYLLPSGYLNSLENSVHEKIHAKAENSIIVKTKPYIFLAASFVIIFGICYGALNIFPGTSAIEEDSLLALIDDGYLESSFIDYYYDEIEINYSEETEELYLNEEFAKEFEEYLTEEDIINYY